MKIKIMYISHNCFVLDLREFVIVFDYSDFVVNEEGDESIKNYLSNRDVIMLFSHAHRDHFSPSMVKFKDNARSFKCVASADILESYPSTRDICVLLKPHQTVAFDGLEIKAYPSSDAGCAYLIKYKGAIIYYGGDNADWRRSGMEEEVQRLILQVYRSSVEEIAAKVGEVDIAFADFCKVCHDFGGLSFLHEKLKPKLLVPMHFFGRIELFKEALPFFVSLKANVFVYEHPGDILEVEI
ncbi:MBL fold metallo-hydrolase [Thermococcus argininiproducens]|uniref:MBL fold metallo-hydrolase n=1 Tax=Thermococcus argininiproducens TaxID=2866384 RepID=A0A9E7M9I4_9EURY|nr:MBL fold metallo-hydrolase [Thermococcus argininiproducens]USG99623.1 MBL fold metallo-hydrolase [Thermococcus argininiproducens]